MKEGKDKRIIGAIAAGGFGIGLLYLLIKVIAPPPPKGIEIIDFKVEKAEAGVAATKKFAPEDSVTTTIYYNNETGCAQERDVMMSFGRYDLDTGQFTARSGGNIIIGEGVFFSMGSGNITSDTWSIPNISGTFDVMVALGTYDPDMGEFSPQDNETHIKLDYIEIEAVAVIANFNLSKG